MKFPIVALLAASLCLAQNASEVRGWLLEEFPRTPLLRSEEQVGALTTSSPLRRVAAPDLSTMRWIGQDGVKILLMRVSTIGTPAVRLHFDDVRLPENARLYVYGLNGDGRITGVQGPFRGTGPLQFGDFWTRALAGEQMVVELQMPFEAATVPFEIRELQVVGGVDEIVGEPESAKPVETRQSVFRGRIVEHQVVDGWAILEGDMVLGRIEALAPAGEKQQGERNSTAVENTYYRWPDGTIPYIIDATLPDQDRVLAAVSHWNTQLAGHLQLVPRTTETYYLRFRRPASAGNCSSSVGFMQLAGQVLSLGDFCSMGNAIHEIGHAVGLYHEHSRPDRDDYIRVLTENIDPSSLYNFDKLDSALTVAPYDYESIMHYPAYGYSINGLPTLETIPAGIPIGQRSGLSALDVSGVKAMYPTVPTTPLPTPAPATVNVAFTSNPKDLPLTVDGTSLITTATRRTRHRVNAVANGGGTVIVSPASADGHYAVHSTVGVEASANTGYCFAGWTGILPVLTPAASIAVTQPYDIGASFVQGAVTVPETFSVPAAAGAFSIPITATTGCIWNAGGLLADWVTLATTSGASSGAVGGSVTANTSRMPRATMIQVNGATIQFVQRPGPSE